MNRDIYLTENAIVKLGGQRVTFRIAVTEQGDPMEGQNQQGWFFEGSIYVAARFYRDVLEKLGVARPVVIV